MSDPVLQPFNTDRDLVTMTDASGRGGMDLATRFYKLGTMVSYMQWPLAVNL